MQGSLFFDGTLVDRTQLRYTETSKSDEILRNRLDWTSRGVYTGGAVTVNSVDTTKIDIAIASGFSPNGEYLETTSTYLSQSLSDYTATTVNYVGFVYTEVNTNYQPHETDLSTYATKAEMSWRLRIYTAAEYAALATTDDNLANDAQDRFLILGKVTANGAGVPLTSASIASPTAYDDLLYATPTIPITGTNITAIDSNMSTGVGTLAWDSAGVTLTWTSAGGGAGAAVPITIDQTYTLLDGAGYYIFVDVVVSQLPASNTSVNVTITDLYYQEIPRLTAEDTLHRSLQGTGVVGPNNPHGLSITDVSGEDLPQIEEHQDIMHCNGIWRGSNSGVFSPTINTAAPSGDTLFIQQPVAGDLFYVNGVKCQNANPGSFLFTAANFTAGSFGATVKEGAKLYEVYVDDDEVVKVNLRTDTNPLTLPARTVTGTWIVDISNEHPAGSYELKCTVAAGPTYTFTWGDGVTDGLAVVIDNTSPPAAPTEGQVIRLYAPDSVNWIDLYVNRSASGPNADSKLPGAGALTDTIEVYDHLVYEENMQVLNVVYWYDGTRGEVGWEADFSGAGDRQTVDKRDWGTICADEIADSGLGDIDYISTDELHYSGILFARDDWGGNFVTSYGGAGLTFPITGGSYYCRGKKLSVEANASLSVSNNTSSLVYADYEGSFQVIDIGAATEFGNDLGRALRWVIGSSFDRKYESDAFFVSDEENYAERGVPLYYLVTSGGNVTRWVDVSRNVNGSVDPWSVGQRRSDPYSSTLTTYLAAFDNLEAAFTYAKIHQDTEKDNNSFLEIKIVGDSIIFAGASVTQPTNTRVVGIPVGASGVNVTSYRDATGGCWLLGGGCSVSGVRLEFDASVTSSSFFGFSSTSVYNVTIENCDFLGVDGTFFVSFGALTSTRSINIVDNYLSVKEGLIYDPTGITPVFYDLNLTGNFILSDPSVSNGSVIDLRFSNGIFGVRIKDNIIYQASAEDGTTVINVSDACMGVMIEGNYIGLKDPGDPSYTAVGIQAEGFTDVRNNIIRCDNIFGSIGSVTSLTVITAIAVSDDANPTSIESNTILYAGVGINLSSMNKKTVSNNKILDFYNRGITVSDTGGDDTLQGLTITNNYLSGDRDAATDGTYTLDNYLKGIEVYIDVNVGTDPLSDISINNNIIPYLINLCASSADVYGIQLSLVTSGAGSSPPVSNISINGNSIDNFVPEGTQDGFGIYLHISIDVPYSIDPTDTSIDNISICNNSVSTNPTASFNDLVGIYLPDYDLNNKGFSVSNNIVNVLTDTPGDNSYGIYSGTTYRLNAKNNIVAANLQAFRSTFKYGVLDGNTLFSYATGVYISSGQGITIENNDITCQTENNIASTAYGIRINSATGEEVTQVLNNTILIKGRSSDGLLANSGAIRGANIEVPSTLKNFIVSGNVTKQSYTSIQGAGPMAHIYVHTTGSGFWSVDNNKIINMGVKGAGTVSDSDGLYIVANASRGIVADNIIFGSNSNLVGGFAELLVNPTAGIVTLNNNRIMLVYTGPGAEQTLINIVGITVEPIQTNVQDTFAAGGAYIGVAF